LGPWGEEGSKGRPAALQESSLKTVTPPGNQKKPQRKRREERDLGGKNTTRKVSSRGVWTSLDNGPRRGRRNLSKTPGRAWSLQSQERVLRQKTGRPPRGCRRDGWWKQRLKKKKGYFRRTKGKNEGAKQHFLGFGKKFTYQPAKNQKKVKEHSGNKRKGKGPSSLDWEKGLDPPPKRKD